MKHDMSTSKSLLTVLFLFITFFTPLNAEDLIIDGTTVTLMGTQYYDCLLYTSDAADE